jgi:hypothetical protein
LVWIKINLKKDICLISNVFPTWNWLETMKIDIDILTAWPLPDWNLVQNCDSLLRCGHNRNNKALYYTKGQTMPFSVRFSIWFFISTKIASFSSKDRLPRFHAWLRSGTHPIDTGLPVHGKQFLSSPFIALQSIFLSLLPFYSVFDSRAYICIRHNSVLC